MTTNDGWVTSVTDGDQQDDGYFNAQIKNCRAELGEVRMFALSMTGAETKSNLQARGWAICDGTTPAAQGISSPTIETTPNLEDKFLRMSDDETSGATGGVDDNDHNHTDSITRYNHGMDQGSTTQLGVSSLTISTATLDNKPPFYELAFFMKVKYVD